MPTRATGFRCCMALLLIGHFSMSGLAADGLQLQDIFKIEFASDPQISPDGETIIYVRNFSDIMTDRQYSNLWSIKADGSKHRPLTNGPRNDGMPRWSPDGTRIVFLAREQTDRKVARTELHCRWIDTGQTARLGEFEDSPADLTWSSDGKHIAFSMLVEKEHQPFASIPAKPAGADWAPPPKVIRRVNYRYDGKGYLKDSYRHLFVISAEGGTPRQVTEGDFDHKGPLAWSPSGWLICSANRNADWELNPQESDLYRVPVPGISQIAGDARIARMTTRVGPDHSPVFSPSGDRIAWLGYDDRKVGYQISHIYVADTADVMKNSPPKKIEVLGGKFNRSKQSPVWAPDEKGLYFNYDDEGHGQLVHVNLDSDVREVADDVGGTVIGRPYQGGSYSASKNGVLAFTWTSPHHPAEVAVVRPFGKAKVLTRLNAGLFEQRTLGKVEEFWFEISLKSNNIQAWLMTPPGFDPKDKDKKYPLILEIHGGPYANYGWRFSAEMQMYAAAGYVVLYVNPRGSTSYGQKFAELIHHNYPGEDYDDLMKAVDVVLKRGFVDPDRLFVTGGSGGGVLTAWVVGKTSRFRAAVSAKPVINWYSFALTTDAYPYFWQYWFASYPWENPEDYHKRSPISLVGNVTTPTMLLTGEQDHRTPITQSEEFYQALKLRGIDTALVRIPEASHAIVKRPSNLMNKVAHILKWFEIHEK
jgi:dipeptidyl aminopeptidase/acylaminoacyl peptidase